MYEHKRIHKKTWISTERRTKIQIHHILVVDVKYGSSIMVVCSYRGADGDTDHVLVAGKVRMRISLEKIHHIRKKIGGISVLLYLSQINSSNTRKNSKTYESLNSRIKMLYYVASS